MVTALENGKIKGINDSKNNEVMSIQLGIYGILEDEEDNLWISTNNGISVFNTKKEKFESLSLSDGI